MALTTVAVAADKQFQRLPNDVLPRNYTLAIVPDLKALNFTGKLEITAEVRTKAKLASKGCV